MVQQPTPTTSTSTSYNYFHTGSPATIDLVFIPPSLQSTKCLISPSVSNSDHNSILLSLPVSPESTPRSFWSILRKLHKSPSTIPTLSHNGFSAVSPESKANLLSHFFSTCFNQSTTPLPDQTFTTPPLLTCPEKLLIKSSPSLSTFKYNLYDYLTN